MCPAIKYVGRLHHTHCTRARGPELSTKPHHHRKHNPDIFPSSPETIRKTHPTSADDGCGSRETQARRGGALHAPGEPAPAGEAGHHVLVCVAPSCCCLPVSLSLPTCVPIADDPGKNRRVLRRQPDPLEAAAQRRRGMPRLHDRPDGQAREGADTEDRAGQTRFAMGGELRVLTLRR